MMNKENISAIALNVWRHKEEILSNPGKYISEFPDCVSGTSFSGPLFLPIGAILECWINCPEFRLSDGRYILRFASGLSGATHGEAISLKSGKITEWSCPSLGANSRSALIRCSEPYRRKAALYVESGILPLCEYENEYGK